ncbi:MAG: hypothetical protein QG597_36 [Actinomycetota bacterium]|nr:hypothetical protein [Actinomycetota bacterium]
MAGMRSRAQLAHEWGVSLATVKWLTARASFPTPGRLGGSARWVAAYSGVRLGELRALRGSDVDTRRRLIRVTRQVTEVDGVPTPGAQKGRKVRAPSIRLIVYPGIAPV